MFGCAIIDRGGEKGLTTEAAVSSVRVSSSAKINVTRSKILNCTYSVWSCHNFMTMASTMVHQAIASVKDRTSSQSSRSCQLQVRQWGQEILDKSALGEAERRPLTGSVIN